MWNGRLSKIFSSYLEAAKYDMRGKGSVEGEGGGERRGRGKQ